MSLFAFILIALLSMSDARFRNGRFERHRPRQRGQRGQMSFKWSRKQHAKGMNVKHYPIHRKREDIAMKEEYTSSPHGLGSNGPNNDDYNPNDADIPEPTLNPETDNESEPVIIDNDIEPFTTMNNIEETHDDSPPIMDCLYNKCHDIFTDCCNNEKCKEFMEDWQQKQSLSYQCLPSSKNKIIDNNDEDVENTDYPMNTEEDEDGNEEDDEDEDEDECEYDELFWNTYHCGVNNYCYNDQLVLASSHEYVLSPSNYRVSPTNITGSKSSSFDYTLLMVAVTSGISAVILVEILRRLYNDCRQISEYENIETKNIESDNDKDSDNNIDDLKDEEIDEQLGLDYLMKRNRQMREIDVEIS